MSEDIINDEPTLAALEDGEALVPTDLVEQYAAAVEEQNAKLKAEAVEESTVELNLDVVEETMPVAVEEAVIDNLIGSPKANAQEKAKSPSLKPVADGVLGSSSANKKDKVTATQTKEKPETVAVFSTKNVTWNGVGKVYRGYNIVTKEQADKWLTRDHIRLATPEEVAKEFNK